MVVEGFVLFSMALPKCRKQVDSPWSWLVCFSSTIIIALTLGTALNFGILFPVLMDYFQETRERTAWVGSIGLSLIFALGPLTGMLVNRFGFRLTTLFGGLSCICGLSLSSLAYNIAIMYATYGVLFGLGGSCLFVSCYVVTSQYFEKRRSIATGIIASGSGIGVIAVAPILRGLLNSFGWKKTYGVMAGIFSVACILGITFDPSVQKKQLEFNQENQESDGVHEQEGKLIEKPKQCFVDFSALKEKMFVVLTVCHMLNNLGHTTPRLHLVKFSEDLLVSADAASRLFIYIGTTTFIGRLLSGFMCNIRCVNPLYVYMFGLVVDGSSQVYLSQAKTYTDLVVFSFLYGLADGVVFGTFYICILNSVEASRKAAAFGLSALCYSPLIATGPALAGFMTDHLHSYIPSFILAAVVAYVAAALLLILIFNKKQTQDFETVDIRNDENVECKGRMLWETSL